LGKDYIEKPFDAEGLRRRIDKVLENMREKKVFWTVS